MKDNLKTILCLLITIFYSYKSYAQADKNNGEITLSVVPNDTSYIVFAEVTDAVLKNPIKDVEVVFYIERMFGLMNIGNETTDSTGIISTAFSALTPGSDTLGNIKVIAKVQDSDVINDLTSRIVVKSKVSFAAHTPLEPGLITSKAPVWLIISFTIVVGSVWFSFIYVLFIIYKIKKSA